MTISRPSKASRPFAWGTIILVVIFFGADAAVANPGLVPECDGETAHIGFSDLPGGSSIRQRLDARRGRRSERRAALRATSLYCFGTT